MTTVAEIVKSVRSKNAGPFLLTIDIFCGNRAVFDKLRGCLSNEKISEIFQISRDKIDRFDIETLNVIKFSIPRPQLQGSIHDRDMHGASWAVLISEIELS